MSAAHPHAISRELMVLRVCRELRDGMVVNLGSQNEISIENLARRVIEVTGSSSGLCYVPYEEAYGEGFDDMFQRIPDLGRARQLVGWEPRYGIDDIIRQVADDLRRG